jgi:2-polyprenyl-3-methyl-5-hydroxy-6-metoxy-1,4-benzoquinol methylase
VILNLLDSTHFNPGGSHRPKGSAGAVLKEFRKGGDGYQRYEFLKGLCKNKRVLDYGCGYGLGSQVLKGNYSEYLGIDIDEVALSWAKANLEDETTHFKTPFEFESISPPQKFDVLAAFEVIELLQTLAIHASVGGKIVVSTPNGAFSKRNPKWYGSKYHLREYYASEFEQLLRQVGSNVKFYEQRRIDHLDTIMAWVGVYVERFGDSANLRLHPLFSDVFFHRLIVGSFLWSAPFWRITESENLDPRPNYSTMIAVIQL